MARVVTIYRIPKDAAAFDAHYFDTYIALAKLLPGLRKYEVVQGLALGESPKFHLVSTFYFDDAQAADLALASPEGLAAEADRRLMMPDDQVMMFLVDSFETSLADESEMPFSWANLTDGENHLLS